MTIAVVQISMQGHLSLGLCSMCHAVVVIACVLLPMILRQRVNDLQSYTAEFASHLVFAPTKTYTTCSLTQIPLTLYAQVC